MDSRPHGPSKWSALGFLAIAELFAMTLWFSASAVVPQLARDWQLNGSRQAWMTMTVQAGFVSGALLSAIFNVSDRISPRTLIAACALLGAGCTAAIPTWCQGGSDAQVALALGLRFATGVTMAGIYPPGMKLVATWCREDRGLGIGILVGAITVGTASPHLLNAIFGSTGMPPWPRVLFLASGLAVLGGALVLAGVREGPFGLGAAPFDWRYVGRAFANPTVRAANLGYLGHMWELYAAWTWVPLFLLDAYARAGWSTQSARIAGFGMIAIGGVGSVLAGVLADRLGRTTITVASLVVSGSCCLVAGLLFAAPGALTVLCLIWGFAVVADSAQFSAAVSERSDPRYVGTALTIQTSLGFLLTMLTIQAIPPLMHHFGWAKAFPMLALGPVVGSISMLRLRRMPDAVRMASGRR
ncbi:MAG: MFS transporter [Candidatus Eisenbacteria bacterium]